MVCHWRPWQQAWHTPCVSAGMGQCMPVAGTAMASLGRRSLEVWLLMLLMQEQQEQGVVVLLLVGQRHGKQRGWSV